MDLYAPKWQKRDAGIDPPAVLHFNAIIIPHKSEIGEI
jgi:hypothetical protein